MARRPRPRPVSPGAHSARPPLLCAGRGLWAVRGVVCPSLRDASHLVGATRPVPDVVVDRQGLV